jgi:competence CoiA-like predicted nuclease
MQHAELQRTIIDLLNLDTEKAESALDLLSQSEELIFKLRRRVEERIQAKNPVYACNSCGQPVVVRSHRLHSAKHTFYFKHLHASGDCPIKTDSTHTKNEIRCMQYNGAKESLTHIELKHYLAEQLRKDGRFTEVKVEEVIKGTGGWSRKWKKPDISALFNGKPVVFEIQLSTTFLDVIVSREVFYLNEGVSIFWIFNNLNPESSRATEKDVFFNNKSNALSINERSKELSLNDGRLVFTGHFKKPYFDPKTNAIVEIWDEVPVKFDDIKFDPLTHKPYFISFDDQYDQAIEEQREAKVQEPIKSFENIVLQHDPDYGSRKECASKLVAIGLYDQDDFDWSFLKFVKALLSVRDGKVHFLNQDGKWAWLTNYVWQHHINYWVVFLYAVSEYERTDTVFNSKLDNKRQEFKDNWKHDPKFKQDRTFYPLLAALLPELRGKLLK